MHVIFSNVTIPAGLDCDLVLTEEPFVAATYGTHAVIVAPRSDPEENDPTQGVWRDAFRGIHSTSETPVPGFGDIVDIAGYEIAQTLFIPAVRGALLAREICNILAADFAAPIGRIQLSVVMPYKDCEASR